MSILISIKILVTDICQKYLTLQILMILFRQHQKMVEKLSSESFVKLLIKLFIALSACLNVVQYGRHVSAEKYNIFSWLRVQNMRDFFLKTD